MVAYSDGIVMAKKLFNFKIEETLHKEFQRYCFENDTTMTDLLIGYIEEVVRGKRKAVERTKQYEQDFDPLAAVREQYD
jgi:hypothetical protein